MYIDRVLATPILPILPVFANIWVLWEEKIEVAIEKLIANRLFLRFREN